MPIHSVKASTDALLPARGAAPTAVECSLSRSAAGHNPSSRDLHSTSEHNGYVTGSAVFPDDLHNHKVPARTTHPRPCPNPCQSPVLAWVQRHQLLISRSLLLLLYATHYGSHYLAWPALYGFTSRFLHLQYGMRPLASAAVYDLGENDMYAIMHGVVLLCFLRLFLMQCCFGPFASAVCKIRSKKARVRFQEQSWSLVYYSVSFFYGGALYYTLDYYMDLDELYRGWPHDQMLFAFKWYYLMQMSFIVQQIIVLNIEERRKDHYQMFSHHIITCLLLLGLYFYYFTRVGHCILLMMDSVDIFLSAAKMLNYTGMRTACDAMFLLFLVSWVVIRHGVYNLVYYHMWHYLGILMADSNCSNPAHPSKRCWTHNIINVFLGLLGGLQILTLVWMYLISKVAYKVITGTGAKDVRSDGEDTDVEDNTSTKTKPPGKEPPPDSNSSSSNNSSDEKTL